MQCVNEYSSIHRDWVNVQGRDILKVWNSHSCLSYLPQRIWNILELCYVERWGLDYCLSKSGVYVQVTGQKTDSATVNKINTARLLGQAPKQQINAPLTGWPTARERGACHAVSNGDEKAKACVWDGWFSLVTSIHMNEPTMALSHANFDIKEQ